jgi:hypothetical protein
MMKAYFNLFEEMQGVMEMSAENIERAEQIVQDYTGSYCNYVLGITWDEDLKMPYIYADGPWEC